jgi:hypothetical protein
MGTIYQRGRTFWIQWCHHGRVYRESARTDSYEGARTLLKQKEGAAANGTPIVPRVDRTTWETAVAELEAHYQASGTRDLKEFAYRRKPLDAFFGRRRLSTIGPADADAYTAARRAEGKATGTIRRELGTLIRALRLAYKHGKLARLPMLNRPPEGPARAGFFEPEQFDAVRRQLPADLRVAVSIAYVYGWRMQSEVLTLERRHVDLEAGTLRLDPGTAKNGDARVVYLTPALRELLAEQLARVRDLERRTGRIVPHLFPYLSGRVRAGQRRRDFRKRWLKATKQAGCPGRLRHDFRRTAVRSMERAGIPRSVATKLTGHRTETVYRRYAIVSDGDLQEAARRLADTIPDTATPVRVDRKRVTR